MKIKFLPLLLLTLTLAGLSGGCETDQPKESQENTTFIFVRHAEKADDGTDDPPLNDVGKKRAAALADHLKETNITAIYSTDFKRTRQTVQQIADSSGLNIQLYNPDDEQVLKNMIKKESGGLVLVSGHSNTTPLLINKLIGEDRYQQFEDSDYDNLFIVMATAVGNGTVVKLTF